MIDIYSISLVDVMPESLKSDPLIKALAEAITPELQTVSTDIAQCIFLPQVDYLSEETLDILAWQLNIDWYDILTDISVKRKLVKGANLIHRYQGTPAAVEEVLQAYFGSGIVREWFEYGGQPGRFKVQVNNASTQSKQINDIYRSITSTKRASSHLDELLIHADMQNSDTSTIVVSSAARAENEMIPPPDPITLNQRYSTIVLSTFSQTENQMAHPPDPITLAERYNNMIISQAHIIVIQ